MTENPKNAKSQIIEAYEDPEPPSERALIAAIMERAVRDILNDTSSRGGEDKQEVRRSSRRWLLNNTKKPFSFIWCCLALDLCALQVRKRILEMEANGEKYVFEFRGKGDC